jgi:hypothetical protein
MEGQVLHTIGRLEICFEKRKGTTRSGALVILTCQFGPPPAAPRALRTAAREAPNGGLDKDNRKVRVTI